MTLKAIFCCSNQIVPGVAQPQPPLSPALKIVDKVYQKTKDSNSLTCLKGIGTEVRAAVWPLEQPSAMQEFYTCLKVFSAYVPNLISVFICNWSG